MTASPAAVPQPGATGAEAPVSRAVMWIVALREITDQLASLRFLAIAILVIGFTPLAVYVGARDYRIRLDASNRLGMDQQALAAGPAGKAVDLQGASWGDYSQLYMLRTIRPPEPMSVLIYGLDGALPQFWDFMPSGATAGPPAWQPRRLADVMGRLDFEFLVRVVLGLLAILLAFDAIVGEKELGTLRTVLSQPVARSAVLAGKLVGGSVTLLISVLGTFLTALLSASIFGIDLISGNWGRLGIMASAALVYLVCLYALGLLISTLAKTQKTSLVVILVLWVFIVLAAPPLASLIAQAAQPVTPAFVLQNRKAALDDDIRKTGARDIEAEYRRLVLQYGTFGKARDEFLQRLGNVLLKSLNRRRQMFNEIDRDAERQELRQGRFAQAMMSISPAAAFVNAVADLAGTGDGRRGEWIVAIERRETALNADLFDDPPFMTIVTGRNPRGNIVSSMGLRRHKPRTLAELLPFAPPRRDLGSALRNSLYSLGRLLLATGALILAAFIAFSKYDVR